MIDIDKLMKALECRGNCRENPNAHRDCKNCDYLFDDEWEDCDDIRLCADAYAILKDTHELAKEKGRWLKEIVEAKEKFCDKPDILVGLMIAQDIINNEI